MINDVPVELMREGHLYSVWWDGPGGLAAWRWKDDVKRLTPTSVQTVGILYRQTSQFITMVLCLADVDTDSEQVAGMICIPIGCIKSAILLRPADE